MKPLTKYLKHATSIVSLTFLLMACSSSLDSSDPTLSTSNCARQTQTVGYGGSPTAHFVLTQQQPIWNDKNRLPPRPTTIFDASSSHDPDGEIVEYKWQFDDVTVVKKTPFANYTFKGSRSVRVTLTVTDNQGNTTRTSANFSDPNEVMCPEPSDPGNA